MRLIYKNGCQLALAIDSIKLRESMLALAEKKIKTNPTPKIRLYAVSYWLELKLVSVAQQSTNESR